MFDIRKKKYAQVILKEGLGLGEGQILFLDIPISESEFANIITEEAFALGAGDVIVIWRANQLEKTRVKNLSQMCKEYRFPFPDETYLNEAVNSNQAAFLRIDSPTFGDDELSPEQVAMLAGESRKLSMKFRKNPNLATCVACVPSPSWAQKVFPDKNENVAFRQLWEYIFQCCRINTPDPIEAWEDYIERTKKRKAILNRKHYTALQYQSAKTSLYLDLVPSEEWFGGYMETANGRRFVPNIPTEEIFTVPHKYSAEGHVTSTLPLNVQGRVIGPFTLYFEKGEVVKWECENGSDVLEAILNTDEGSRRLGEAALVEQGSPIARTGVIYYDTLFDENASCHLALGMGGAPFLPEEERERRGLNTSIQHVDFMIGSNDMLIQGRLPDGTWEDVLVEGKWVGEYL